MGFTKLDSGIIHSSIWSESECTRVVWITILALSDENGFVACSKPGLLRAANVPSDEFENALKTLESPDKYSRTPDNEGRRIEEIEGGWIILNFMKYRSRSEVIKEQTRERVRKFREKSNVTHGNVSETLPSASASASASASSSEGEGIKGEGLWRFSFENYQAEIQRQFQDLKKDTDWLEDRQRYHRGLDIALSIEKAMNDFWGTEEGWAWKKKSRKAKEINLKSTLTKALSDKRNQVWKPRAEK